MNCTALSYSQNSSTENKSNSVSSYPNQYLKYIYTILLILLLVYDKQSEFLIPEMGT